MNGFWHGPMPKIENTDTTDSMGVETRFLGNAVSRVRF